MGMPHGEESHLLRCVQCGAFFPARTTDDKLVPSGGTTGGTCYCGSEEFEQVTIAWSG